MRTFLTPCFGESWRDGNRAESRTLWQQICDYLRPNGSSNRLALAFERHVEYTLTTPKLTSPTGTLGVRSQPRSKLCRPTAPAAGSAHSGVTCVDPPPPAVGSAQVDQIPAAGSAHRGATGVEPTAPAVGSAQVAQIPQQLRDDRLSEHQRSTRSVLG